jgi:hypothetical protein
MCPSSVGPLVPAQGLRYCGPPGLLWDEKLRSLNTLDGPELGHPHSTHSGRGALANGPGPMGLQSGACNWVTSLALQEVRSLMASSPLNLQP